MFTKISILLQYGRIFTVREMRIPLHIVMAICILWGIVTIITSIFTCVPVQAYWKILEQPSAKCIENKT
jgi:predicted benzoate:H+ symporter BenE